MTECPSAVRAASRARVPAEGDRVVHRAAVGASTFCSVELSPGPHSAETDLLTHREVRVVAVRGDLDLRDRGIGLAVREGASSADHGHDRKARDRAE